jgi:signal peptidase I
MSFKLKSLFSGIVVLLIISAVKSTYFCRYSVPANSMSPTINRGDVVWANLAYYNFKIPWTNFSLFEINSIKRGDLVVYLMRDVKSDTDVIFLKRVIGVGGDKVYVQNQTVNINDVPVKRSPNPESDKILEKIEKSLVEGADEVTPEVDNIKNYSIFVESIEGRSYNVMNTKKSPPPFGENSHVIGKGFVYLLGDNRENSYASRFIGDIPIEKVIGKVIE